PELTIAALGWEQASPRWPVVHNNCNHRRRIPGMILAAPILVGRSWFIAPSIHITNALFRTRLQSPQPEYVHGSKTATRLLLRATFVGRQRNTPDRKST